MPSSGFEPMTRFQNPKSHPFNTTNFKSYLCARLQWRNRLARRTYKQYKAAKRWFLSHAEVVSSSLTWSIGFRWLLTTKTMTPFCDVWFDKGHHAIWRILMAETISRSLTIQREQHSISRNASSAEYIISI